MNKKNFMHVLLCSTLFVVPTIHSNLINDSNRHGNCKNRKVIRAAYKYKFSKNCCGKHRNLVNKAQKAQVQLGKEMKKGAAFGTGKPGTKKQQKCFGIIQHAVITTQNCKKC